MAMLWLAERIRLDNVPFIPPLDDGISFTQVSAGCGHTVLLQSDGTAVACGENSVGQYTIPLLDDGISYTMVSAGEKHTVLLRSDGNAAACGMNSNGQCTIPPLGTPFCGARRALNTVLRDLLVFLESLGWVFFQGHPDACCNAEKLAKEGFDIAGGAFIAVRGGPEPLQFYGKSLHVS